MRTLVFTFFVGLSFLSHSQHEFQVWKRLGAEGDVIKRLDWQFELNTRFGDRGINTFFPQAGLEYKVKKWFRPSIEYRYILDQDRYGNFGGGHRFNFNANFRENMDRWSLRARLRYQYAFNRLAGAEEFDADFDQAFRTKVKAGYDIDENIFSPAASAELFYNPQFGPSGPGFTKVRLSIGSSLELDGPHSLSFRYIVDKRFDPSRDTRHVVAFSYGYTIK